VAAAAVKLAHVAAGGDEPLQMPEPQRAGQEDRRPRRVDRPAPVKRGDGLTRIFVGAGRNAGIRPADLVGAITGEARIASGELGAIEIADRFSLVEVPQDRADDIVAAMRKATLRGQKVQVRRDREAM
jgi:ATP-dependent RNA helicase DeaD